MENNVTLQQQFDKDAITSEEVKDFLDQFNAKMKIFGISFHIAECPLKYPFKTA